MWRDDPLEMRNPRLKCPACGGRRRERRRCEQCSQTGYTLAASLAGSWSLPGGKAGFLVCGGPSLSTYPLDDLRERGVLSLGVNNAAAYAQCNAFVFGDPQWKFHHSLFLDPKVLAFCPMAKLRRTVRYQEPAGAFRTTELRLEDCPNTYGFPRSGRFDGDTFLSTYYAHWGHGGKAGDQQQPFRRLATMLLGLRLLHYLGVERVYLLGVDFHMAKARPYAWGGDATSGNRLWAKINAMLTDATGALGRAGMTVRNCNQHSGCTVFPFAAYGEALADCRGGCGGTPDLRQWYSRRVRDQDAERYPDSLPETFPKKLSEKKL